MSAADVTAAPIARDANEPVLLQVADMAKAFGPTQALRACGFELKAGEVHALVGENGSGKSTLVKILSGVHAPDAGTIVLGGVTGPDLRTPRAAQQSGIVTVFQEVLVAEASSVLDNVWLGVDSPLRSRVPKQEKRDRARAALAELLDRPPGLDTPVEDLSLSDRQSIGIVRALLRRPRILILDEATSALDIETRDRLFAIVQRLSREGVGVVLITHRMDEIDQIGDRITVMRSGTTVGTLARGEWNSRVLVQMMTGSDQMTEGARHDAASIAERTGDVVLEARGLQLKGSSRPFDLRLRAGELVGVAGLEGHGQTQFLEALWGMHSNSGGEVVRHGDNGETVVRSPAGAAQQDIAYVPRERRLDSLFSWMSIRENFAMPTMAKDRRNGFLSTSASRKRLESYREQLNIVLGDPDDAITTLSGGNQQKVIIARWLASNPKVLLLNDPTRGIDVNAKRDLYQLLTRLASEGLAVVMLSTELDEHIELMDRVLIFREHELFKELDRASLTRSAMLASFFGEEGDADGDRSAG
ncbi:sugar ABC transporter ATP-binding protein [Conexibacter sp. CPCC 206217]|uniref:sugar ABC transporter ATP-binding protein n=1 Tax=Conexibacter sp. CPCC 206217 TaxID=3064574 RepID=UPI0027162826|nr:sugar ABC transporter ATP-binding protein [Conexibacter sp. CPCC 206217]MDO8211171.1 sugar ABC transporter ATP-binding protein [Conexibacter sp. CPCC 206217]